MPLFIYTRRPFAYFVSKHTIASEESLDKRKKGMYVNFIVLMSIGRITK